MGRKWEEERGWRRWMNLWRERKRVRSKGIKEEKRKRNDKCVDIDGVKQERRKKREN